MKWSRHLGLAAIWLVQAIVPALGLPNPGSASTAPTYAGVPTRTKVVSTTITSITVVIDWINPRVFTLIDSITVTTLQPGPFTSLPTTITQWVISSVTHETRVFGAGAGSTVTQLATWIGTAPETFVLYEPQATDLPASTDPDAVLCDGCPDVAATPAPDPACEALGLHTGCQGQCALEDGVFWCLQRWRAAQDRMPAMGRACWGGNREYLQLMTPCRTGDFRIGCTACHGGNVSYAPVDWLGAGAEGGPWIE